MFLFKKKQPYEHPKKERRVHCIIFDRGWARCAIDRWLKENEYSSYHFVKKLNQTICYIIPRKKFNGVISRKVAPGIMLMEGV